MDPEMTDGTGNAFKNKKHFLLPVRLRLRQKFVPREN
jgi:hypothetical protein